MERPWLCWNVHDDWCLLQQKLVVRAGWTPVVGFDPRCGPPQKLVREAILIDFNQHLRLPNMLMHVPLEFVFLFADKLAFWHSDLLVPEAIMMETSALFTQLEQGQTAAVECILLRNIFSP